MEKFHSVFQCVRATGESLWRLIAIAAVLYFAIAAYGCYHRQQLEEREAEQYVCPCDECECGRLEDYPELGASKPGQSAPPEQPTQAPTQP